MIQYEVLPPDVIHLVVRGDGTYELGTDLRLTDAVETIRDVLAKLAIPPCSHCGSTRHACQFPSCESHHSGTQEHAEVSPS